MDIDSGFRGKPKSVKFYLEKVKELKEGYKNEIKRGFKKNNVELVPGDKVWYMDIVNSGNMLNPIWNVTGTVKEAKFNSYKILLSDGREIIASRNHVKKFRGEECGKETIYQNDKLQSV